MNALEVSGLKKSYHYAGKTFEAVRGVSFNIKKGEIFGLLGPNGAGKTTTINMITGILEKDAGEIQILGKNPNLEHEYVRNRMNIVSAYYGMSDIMTAWQNLKVYGKIYNIPYLKEKIDGLLKQFGLYELKDKRTNTLSSGEKTRLNLCKGLLNDPEVLLLDECTVGLDPDVAERTRTIIKDYQKEKKAAILFTSHYMYEVEELCNRIAFMAEGRILKIDTATNLKKIIKKQAVEITFLHAKPGLKQFFMNNNVDVETLSRNAIRFEISAKGTELYKLMNKLFKEGYKIRDMKIDRPTLDDVFITIARKNSK